MKLALLLALLPLASLGAAPCPVGLAQDPTVPATATKPYKLNFRITEDPTLPDLEGTSHALFGKYPKMPLVLVFWSYKDPVSRFYAPHLAALQKAKEGKIAIVLVNSNYDELVSGGDPLAKLRKVIAAEKVTLPLLLDHDNQLADDFGATANGQAFLIDGNQFLRYHGGIDDDPKGERRKAGTPLRTWLENAIDEILTGDRPKENWTRPSGRPIKRVPEARAK